MDDMNQDGAAWQTFILLPRARRLNVGGLSLVSSIVRFLRLSPFTPYFLNRSLQMSIKACVLSETSRSMGC